MGITQVGGVADRLDSCDTALRSQRAEGMMRQDTHKVQYAKALHLGRHSSRHRHTLGTDQLESSLAQDAGTWQTMKQLRVLAARLTHSHRCVPPGLQQEQDCQQVQGNWTG